MQISLKPVTITLECTVLLNLSSIIQPNTTFSMVQSFSTKHISEGALIYGGEIGSTGDF